LRHVVQIYIIKADVCLSVCQHYNVRLTSPPVLKLLDSQGYLWLSYDLTEVIKLIGERFEQKKKSKNQKINLCHSFRIIVIPSILLSFLPDYCHSFRIFVIPSILVSFLPNIVIPSEIFRELQILTSSKSFPYPKGEKNGHQRWPYLRVIPYVPLILGQLLDLISPTKINISEPRLELYDPWDMANCLL
jgi:hypothetical protein